MVHHLGQLHTATVCRHQFICGQASSHQSVLAIIQPSIFSFSCASPGFRSDLLPFLLLPCPTRLCLLCCLCRTIIVCVVGTSGHTQPPTDPPTITPTCCPAAAAACCLSMLGAIFLLLSVRHFVHELLRVSSWQHERAAGGAVFLPLRLHRNLVRFHPAGKTV